MQKMAQLISSKIILLLFFLNGMFFLRSTGQVYLNKGIMVPGKAISTDEIVGLGKYLFSYKIILVETAKKDSVGIIYDSTILEKRVNKLRIAKDSTYIFNIINPDGIDNDCTSFKLYLATDISPLYNHVWIKFVETFRKNK